MSLHLSEHLLRGDLRHYVEDRNKFRSLSSTFAQQAVEFLSVPANVTLVREIAAQKQARYRSALIEVEQRTQSVEQYEVARLSLPSLHYSRSDLLFITSLQIYHAHMTNLCDVWEAAVEQFLRHRALMAESVRNVPVDLVAAKSSTPPASRPSGEPRQWQMNHRKAIAELVGAYSTGRSVDQRRRSAESRLRRFFVDGVRTAYSGSEQQQQQQEPGGSPLEADTPQKPSISAMAVESLWSDEHIAHSLHHVQRLLALSSGRRSPTDQQSPGLSAAVSLDDPAADGDGSRHGLAAEVQTYLRSQSSDSGADASPLSSAPTSFSSPQTGESIAQENQDLKQTVMSLQSEIARMKLLMSRMSRESRAPIASIAPTERRSTDGESAGADEAAPHGDPRRQSLLPPVTSSPRFTAQHEDADGDKGGHRNGEANAIEDQSHAATGSSPEPHAAGSALAITATPIAAAAAAAVSPESAPAPRGRLQPPPPPPLLHSPSSTASASSSRSNQPQSTRDFHAALAGGPLRSASLPSNQPQPQPPAPTGRGIVPPPPPPPRNRPPAEVEVSEEEKKKRSETFGRVAFELLTTERTYVRLLTALKTHFIDALPSADGADDSLVSIFGDAELILNINASFLQELEKCFDGTLLVASIADVFQSRLAAFRLYSNYINSYLVRWDALKRAMSSKKKFAQFVAEAQKHPDCQGQNLESLLILPIQRIPRYELLLKELVKQAGPEHQEYGKLCLARDDVQKISEYCNEKKKDVDERMRVAEIADLYHIRDLVQPHRRVIREGTAAVAVSTHGASAATGGKPAASQVFLFNDMILLVLLGGSSSSAAAAAAGSSTGSIGVGGGGGGSSSASVGGLAAPSGSQKGKKKLFFRLSTITDLADAAPSDSSQVRLQLSDEESCFLSITIQQEQQSSSSSTTTEEPRIGALQAETTVLQFESPEMQQSWKKSIQDAMQH